MKFERGLSAYVAAGFDRLQTLLRPSGDWIDKGDGNSTIVFHFRESGEWKPVQLPNGEIQVMNEADIVHIYDGKRLVERKRLKDKPQGFREIER